MKNFRKVAIQPMRPYVLGEDLTGISVSDPDMQLGTLEGGMIAVSTSNPNDKWYVAKAFFDANYEEVKKSTKSLGNTDVNGAKKNVSDLVGFGNGDMFKLLSKASSKNEGWMKSTKAMEIEGLGCLVQVTTQQGDNVAEALQFIPGVSIEETCIEGICVSRNLIKV